MENVVLSILNVACRGATACRHVEGQYLVYLEEMENVSLLSHLIVLGGHTGHKTLEFARSSEPANVVLFILNGVCHGATAGRCVEGQFLVNEPGHGRQQYRAGGDHSSAQCTAGE